MVKCYGLTVFRQQRYKRNPGLLALLPCKGTFFSSFYQDNVELEIEFVTLRPKWGCYGKYTRANGRACCIASTPTVVLKSKLQG